MPPSRHLVPKSAIPPVRVGLDPVLTVGTGGAIAFAAMLGGPLWAGLAACAGGTYLYAHWQQQRVLEHQRQAQENLSHFLHGNGSAEELAKLRGAADVGGDDLYGFLQGVVTTYGGESVRGSTRLPSEDQLEAIAPGITLTLAHDLGIWYAKLAFAGDTGRKFLNGEMTQWKARGRTPDEAVLNVMKKAGLARQRQAIQDYAQRMVADAE